MKTEKRVVKWLQDPGHGWLSVRLCDLIRLGIHGQVSHFSYIKGTRVYLEEDSDAGLYLKAAKAAGWTLEIKESHSNSWSFVRRMPHFPASFVHDFESSFVEVKTVTTTQERE